MGILKALFGGGSKGEGHPFIYDDGEIRTRNEVEKNLLQQIQGLTYEKHYEGALRTLLQFTDLHPERRRFFLFTSATVLRAYGHDQGVTTVDPGVFGDPRLDAVFMHCSRDNSIWLPMNQIKGRRPIRTSGGDPSQCPKCNQKGVRGRPDRLRPAEYATADFIEIKSVREHPAGSWTLGQGKPAVCAIIVTKTSSEKAIETIKLDHADLDSQTNVVVYAGNPTTDHKLLSALAARWFGETNTSLSQGLFAGHGFAGVEKFEYVIMKGF